MFGSARRERQRLERSGKRAPATVVEIARFGWSIGSGEPGRTVSNGEIVRMTTLRVQPEGEPEFEVKKRIRYGLYGREVPKAGDQIDVLYDPADHEKIVVAPPTAEEERARQAAALRDSNVGFAVSSHPAGTPLPEEAMKQHQAALAQAEQAQQLMQQYMSGAVTPGEAGTAEDVTAGALAQLEALKASGALSDEEYAEAKARLLGEG